MNRLNRHILAAAAAVLLMQGDGNAMTSDGPIHEFPPLRHGLKAVFGNNGNDHGGDYETRIPRMIELFQELDVHLTRIELRWVVVEAERGVYDWSEYDRLIGALHEGGVEPMLMFYAPPLWSMVGPPEDEELFIRQGMENLYTVVWPRDEYKADLRRFAKAAAERYKGKARLFEFWNEPDGMGAPIVQRDKDGKARNIRFGGDPVRYTEWLKVFYEGVKEGNPDAIVGAGSLCEPFTYSLEAMYGSGGKEYFDAVTCHPYGDTINVAFVESLREVMVRYGDWRKPIWITEFGWTTGGDSVDPVNPKPTTGMLKQAESIPPMFETMQQLPYVTQFYYFTLNDWDGDNGFGVVDYPLNKKPSFEVYRRVVAQSPTEPRPVAAPGVIARAPVTPIAGTEAIVQLVNERDAATVTVDVTGRPIFPSGKAFTAGRHEWTAEAGVTTVSVPCETETPGVYAFDLTVDGNRTDAVVVTHPLAATRRNGAAGFDDNAPGIYRDDFLTHLQFAWDDTQLYVKCAVSRPDPEFAEATADGLGERLWAADSLQLGFDPLRDAVKGAYQRPDDSEFTFALTRNRGPVARRNKAIDDGAVGPFVSGQVAIGHSDGIITYELGLPWSEIHPGQPRAGDVIGVSVLVNYVENGERQVHEWGGGIVHKKLPSLFGAVRLQ